MLTGIITRTKNRPFFLKRAIDSVCRQTHTDWLHVIVNDGGESEPVDSLVASYPESYRKKCKVLHLPKSLGMEAASNHAIRSFDSQYLVILDDDDSWHPEFLAKTTARLDKKRIPTLGGVVTFAVKVIEQVEGTEVREVKREPFNDFLQAVTLYEMAAGNLFTTNSFLFERKAWEEVGGFDPELPVLGDWEFNIRFLAKFDIDLVHESLSYFHHRVTNQQSSFGNSGVGGRRDHIFYSMFIRNRLIRQDLKDGKFGLGMLVNNAWGLGQVALQITHMEHSLPHRKIITKARGFLRGFRR